MKKEITQFNLNYDMELNLTKSGKEFYDEYRITNDKNGMLPRVGDGGILRLQAWRVMAIFGSQLEALKTPFNMNVQLCPFSEVLDKPIVINV